jgi:hypothetical protein
MKGGHAMIISASRRTDIPAFYSNWLLNRLREGYALVRNPFNPQQVSRVSLDPQIVDCLVFWTKNPASLLPRLDEIDRLGHRSYFQFTLTGYDRNLEPYVPELAERIAVFRRLAEQIGPERVLWRFDPILFTRSQGPDALLHDFAELAGQLHSCTRQCTISFLSLYEKCKRNLQGIALQSPDNQEKKNFIRQMAGIAEQNGMVLRACCDSFLHDQCAVESARCIDNRLLAALLGQPVRVQKDKGQRPGCGCAASVDIGAYNTCPHGCRYCYANVNERVVSVNRAAHDPCSPLLTGVLTGQETITERTIPSFCSPQGALF